MNILVIGRKYTGKSTLALYLAETIRKKTGAYKVLIFDPKWCFKSVAYATELGDFSDLIDEDLKAVAFRPAKSFADDDKEQVRRDFTSFCETTGLDTFLRQPPERPIIVLIDEAQYLMEGKYIHPWLSRLIRLATRNKIFVILATHRPTDFSPFVRGQADEFFIFQVTLPEDLDVIREITSEEASQIIFALPDYHVLKYDLKTRKHEIWKDPKGWYSDLSEDFYEKETKENARRVRIGSSGGESGSDSGRVLGIGHEHHEHARISERSGSSEGELEEVS